MAQMLYLMLGKQVAWRTVCHTLCQRNLPANSEQGRDVEVGVSQATQLFNSLKWIIIEIILSTLE